LVSLFKTLQTQNSFYQFAGLLNGSQMLVGKATALLKQDIDRLPFPDDPTEISLSFWEEDLKDDLLNFMSDYVRLVDLRQQGW
jgi:hypothetical protein